MRVVELGVRAEVRAEVRAAVTNGRPPPCPAPDQGCVCVWGGGGVVGPLMF